MRWSCCRASGIWQFATLPELGLKEGDEVSLSVNGYQETSGALKARLCLMLIESDDGEWSPADFGLPDKRTFAKHGRGELIRAPQRDASVQETGKEFQLQVNGLKVDPRFKTSTGIGCCVPECSGCAGGIC